MAKKAKQIKFTLKPGISYMFVKSDKPIQIGCIMRSIPDRNPASAKGIIEICTNMYTHWENGWGWERVELKELI